MCRFALPDALPDLDAFGSTSSIIFTWHGHDCRSTIFQDGPGNPGLKKSGPATKTTMEARKGCNISYQLSSHTYHSNINNLAESSEFNASATSKIPTTIGSAHNCLVAGQELWIAKLRTNHPKPDVWQRQPEYLAKIPSNILDSQGKFASSLLPFREKTY